MRGPTHRLPGLVTVDHWLDVPLDHARPDAGTIRLFAREVRAPGTDAEQRPWLVYLQGGPGSRAPRPQGTGGWLGRALRDHRVLLLDQRGTGRSSPLTRQTLPRLGAAEAQAAYLRHFRADAIVRDAEALRRALAGDRPWLVLGQSYGGFCATTYLSLAPEGLAGVLVAGGLPGLYADAEQVYGRTYPRVVERNASYHRRYPGDRDRLHRVRDVLARSPVRLPGGDLLTVPRLQTLGRGFGMSDGYERCHYLLEEAFVDGTPDRLSDSFLHGVQEATGFVGNPLYAVVHESIYAQGDAATGWAAQRVRERLPEFRPEAHELLLTGEMIYPWMFTEYGELAGLGPAAEALARATGWPSLYDPVALARNEVPVAAVAYHDDMYVDLGLSRQTAAEVGGLRLWVTNEFDHDGLRQDERVLDRLLDLLNGRA